MKQLKVAEIRSELPRLEELLAQEGEIVITRRGKPIARVLPMRQAKGTPSHAALRALIPRLTHGSENYVRADRDER
jgi:antitoxin (DNA-binding transcriptional repressor) of toxin-antitoxin stability system